ncbi:MAG: aldehyde ferredoxin oxidoreductase [Clostridiales Family XIII bacterium]|jgi:aldehyde:ferredoxin oxidoreductase|nr:aldehyde ferredoxin oxidoreductase [Clostridiales Family XIII bacterium]
MSERIKYGYIGKIARINLTDETVSVVDTFDYVPKYIGGRAVANRIFYDEVAPGVGAFDPENKVIYMTGPTTGTGIPTGGRSVFCSIAANNYPEQYAWSGIGGWIGAELKFAGWDGIIIEGKAKEPVYIFIEDDNIQFINAAPLWGMLVHRTQAAIREAHGDDVISCVIGPAGENLVRNASITTSSDNVAAKAGLGAVFGSKNLKAFAVRGTGVVVPADIEKLFYLRKHMGTPYMRPSPIIHEEEHGMDGNRIAVEGGWDRGQVACSHGCNQHCCRLMMNVPSAFPERETVNQVEKCVGIFAYGFQEDCSWSPIMTWETKENSVLPCKMLSNEPPPINPDDPYLDVLFDRVSGDITNYWKPDFRKGSVMMHLCNEYGIDKWDVIIWYMTWIASCKAEGLLDDLGFAMEPDAESEEFVRYFLDMITYRKGRLGEIFAEGMARATRSLGHEKYGKTIYNGRYSQVIPGLRLDIPVSLESAWGMSYHWAGRGYEATIDKPGWLAVALELMTVTRDNQTVAHFHDTYDHLLAIGDDPCHSEVLIDSVIMNENKGEMKDSISTCEWQSPDLFWTSMEAEMYTAATGIEVTEEEINDAAERSKLLMRAITMRNFGRDREMEVNAVFPTLQYPDPRGETVTWDDWNDFVDLYYKKRGWDIATGWPTRETWERYGLKDVADDMAAIGKLPA